MENKEYWISYNYQGKSNSGVGSICFSTNEKLNGKKIEALKEEIAQIIKKEVTDKNYDILQIAKNKLINEEYNIVILNIINLSDL